MWPNLFVGGVTKAGTSTLHRILDSHPDICMSRVKEPHFFTRNIRELGKGDEHTTLIRDETQYLNLFAHGQQALYRGESSPSYFWEKASADRIKARSPESKVIVILRDPIARAFSHYHMDFQADREKNTSFYKAMQHDAKRPEKGWGISRLYVELGFYADSLQYFRQVFGQANVLVLFHESAFVQLEETKQQIATFLGIGPFARETVQTINQGSYQGKLGKLLKFIPLRQLVPPSIRQKVKSWTSVRNLQPNAEEIDFLYAQYREELIRLDRELGMDYYTHHFKTHYNLDLFTC